jgi:hypothetical protein
MAAERQSLVQPSVWRNPHFLALLAAQTVSLTGKQVTALALPTMAILALHAGPWQVGLLVTSMCSQSVSRSSPAGCRGV